MDKNKLQLVFKQEANQVLMTDSRRLAEGFGAEHKNVLQKIERILADTDTNFRVLNFQQADEEVVQASNGSIQKHKVYKMTRDGFMFIARTFTGKKGNAFAIKVIELFNAMEAELNSTDRSRAHQTTGDLFIQFGEKMNVQEEEHKKVTLRLVKAEMEILEGPLTVAERTELEKAMGLRRNKEGLDPKIKGKQIKAIMIHFGIPAGMRYYMLPRKWFNDALEFIAISPIPPSWKSLPSPVSCQPSKLLIRKRQ